MKICNYNCKNFVLLLLCFVRVTVLLPLCVFTLAPPFTIQEFIRPLVQSSTRRSGIPYWRRKDCSLPRTRPRFKPSLRRSSYDLAKYLTGRVKNRRIEALPLQEVLNTIKRVWTSPNILFKSSSSPNMEDRCKKSSAPSDIPSPVLLRRRLSAPEAIMRKHMLAQQQSNSQDSDTTQTSDVRSCQWRMERGIGSDSNLNRKRDHSLMRKSTLMRRFWCSNKPLLERNSRFTASYYDWQYVKLFKDKSTQSLDSAHSSPEHLKYRSKMLPNDELIASSMCKKYENGARKTKAHSTLSVRNHAGETRGILSEVDEPSTIKHKIFNEHSNARTALFKTPCCSNCLTSFENPSSSMNSRLSTTKTPTTTVTTETESSEFYSTRSTSTTGTTTYSDNSDSAYTNSHSNFTHTSNGNTSSICTTTYSSEKFLEENGNIVENENANECKNVEFALPEAKRHFNLTTPDNSETHVIPESVNDSSTQTSDTANLNVISNVQLSQSTLNLIFNKVMQDVKKFPATNINISTVSATVPLRSDVNNAVPQSKVINVQEIPSFYLKQKDQEELVPSHEQHRSLKFMVSKVGTGSPYSKPAEAPQVVVPRYSALPRTTSMEVNTSSGESTDRESDNVSLVDSLEDPSSPRVDINRNNKYDDKPVRGDLSPLLPDNSSSHFSKVEGKSSAFFIPIETNAEVNTKSVADHLPEKVRERLSRRQLKREQKLRQTRDKMISPKSDSNYVSASDNGNQVQCVVDSLKYTHSASGSSHNINTVKNRRKIKPTLPSIEPIRKSKIDSKGIIKHAELEKIKDKKMSKIGKRKMICKSQELSRENSINEKKQPQWMSKTRQKVLERLSPLYSTKNEFVYGIIPRKNFRKAELSNTNKRIEILEIVECIETIPRSGSQRNLKKSKIPVLVNSRLPNIPKNDTNQKPTFLDVGQIHEIEPKIDQLIANILIDALNKSEIPNLSEETQKLPTNMLHILEKRPAAAQSNQIKHQGNKYQRTFEAIPEERTASLASSSEDHHSNSATDCSDMATNNKDSKNGTPNKQYSGNKTLNGTAATANSGVPDGHKGKAALGIIKDENFSTIPKGWITFYTLHKSQGSPESTSDEGKKKLSGNESRNCSGNLKEDNKKRKELDRISEDDNITEEKLRNSKNIENLGSNQQNVVHAKCNGNCMVTSKEQKLSQDSFDTWSTSDQEKHNRALHPLPHTGYVCRNQQNKGRHKNSDPYLANKMTPGGWTVTVSGTTNGGHFAPDLEMRLTFPRNVKQDNPADQSDSDLRRENSSNKKRENFPYLIPPKDNNYAINSPSRTKNSCSFQQLPQIMKHRSTKKSRQYEGGYSATVQGRGKMESRHNTASSQRLLVNRPRTFITPAEFLDIDTDESNLKEILNKFPEILRITGNAINPEQKPRVPTMSERDITRNLYRNT